MRVLFMGTPGFAVPSLAALADAGEELIGAVTQPDRPKGRGERVASPAVKDRAVAMGIPVYQPAKVREPGFLKQLQDLSPDLIVVVAFGQILPKALLEIPGNGCINVHASLLPKYRGAAPINWAVIRGERETGITTMLMDEGMGTGPILLQEKVPIGPKDTAESLAGRMQDVGAKLLVRTIGELKTGSLKPRPQDSSQATMAPLLKKEDGLIQWNQPAAAIANRVRGLVPWPGAYTFYGPVRWQLWEVSALDAPIIKDAAPGEILGVEKDEVLVATGDRTIRIEELQPENKRRMKAREYLAGHRMKAGTILGKTAG
jgi:methionyl-tRNA formyltransferase